MSDLRERLFCTAVLLDQGRFVDRLSRPLTAAALMGVLIYPVFAPAPRLGSIGILLMVAVCGLLEAYLAIRVAIDAALFHRVSATAGPPEFALIDAALRELGLLPPEKVDRPVDVRVAGARRLFRCQILALAAQVVAVPAGVWLAWIWR